MSKDKILEDKAGDEYWSEIWQHQNLPKMWDVESVSIKNHVKHSFFLKFKEVFRKYVVHNKKIKLIEVGCARSQILPVFTKYFGFKSAGLDYSKVGCDQAKAILEKENIQGKIYWCDIFNIPKDLIGKFDIVVSFGLIEHFSDTTSIVSALSTLLAPNGMIFTNVPNMTNLMGLLQRLFDKKIYDIHNPISKEDIKKAHEDAGLNVVDCDYFFSSNFLVLNINSIKKNTFEWWSKKIFLNVLAAVSVLVWSIEKTLKLNIKPSAFFSPYINCVAIKKR